MPKNPLKPAPKKSKAAPAKAAVTKAPVAKKKNVEPHPKPEKKVENYFYANGKRKTAVASIRLYENGKGDISVNDRSFERYFPLLIDQDKILSPLFKTSTRKTFNIWVKVRGGGVHSQAEAVRHGIAKALLVFNAGLRSTLKPLGFLTRDARVKERKKYGLHRARRAPQWQKR